MERKISPMKLLDSASMVKNQCLRMRLRKIRWSSTWYGFSSCSSFSLSQPPMININSYAVTKRVLLLSLVSSSQLASGTALVTIELQYTSSSKIYSSTSYCRLLSSARALTCGARNFSRTSATSPSLASV